MKISATEITDEELVSSLRQRGCIWFTRATGKAVWKASITSVDLPRSQFERLLAGGVIVKDWMPLDAETDIYVTPERR